MAGNLQPLSSNFAIVDARGNPTEYFIRWAQQKQIDIQGAVTPAEALAIATQYLTDFLADHPLLEGSGIGITPSGNLSDDITIAAKVQDILDQISTTQGTVLFRGATDWQALAPGAAGQFLKTNGAGADPAWAAPPGGGGGALNLISRSVLGSAAPNVVFSAIPNTYEDLIITIVGQLTGAAVDFIWASFNGDFSAANYQWIRGNFQNSGIFYSTGSNIGMDVGLMGPGLIGSGFADALEATIFSYARTTFYKKSLARSALRFGTAANQTSNEIQTSDWLSTAAINSVQLTPNSGNFAAGTVVSLFGRG